MKAIPTKYRGRQYRSRLEARWACMFDLLGWRYEYEPFDLPGWIPDFLITAAGREFLVEVKPTDSCDVTKATSSVARRDHRADALLLTSTPFQVGYSNGLTALGRQVWRRAGETLCSEAVLGRLLEPASDWCVFAKKPEGENVGPSRLWRPEETWSDLGAMWAEAANEVQWRAPGQFHPPAAMPAPKAPARTTAVRRVDPLEALFAALAIRVPALLGGDTYRVRDELLHAGVRQTLPGGEALEDVDPDTRSAIQSAFRQVPEFHTAQQAVFDAVCRKLKLRRIDEQLSHIARVTGQVANAPELNEESGRLQSERVELLALRRLVIEAHP